MTRAEKVQIAPIEHDIQLEDTLVFLHIPKTGGVTLGAFIDPMWLPGQRCPEYMTFPLARLPREKIREYRSFTGHFRYDALKILLPSGFYCITMLREPTSRHLSHMRMLRRIMIEGNNPANLPVLFQLGNPLFFQMVQNTSREDDKSIYSEWKKLSLEELIEERTPQEIHGLINTQTTQLVPNRHPPGEVQTVQRELLLNEAIENLSAMLYFGLMERFQDSLFLLSFVFGWQPFLDTLRHNEGPDKMQPGSLSGKVRASLAGYNDLDLKLYAFAQEEFQRRFDQMTRTLLERYGLREHAQLQPPIPPEILFELLEIHYRERFRQRHAKDSAPSGLQRFTFDEPIDSSLGWQRLESFADKGSYRWTGPGNTASVDLPPVAISDIDVEIGMTAARKPELLTGMRVFVNNTELSGQYLPKESEISIYKMVVPRILVEKQPYLRICLQTDAPGSLHELEPDNPDSRQVGVAVSWIEQRKA